MGDFAHLHLVEVDATNELVIQRTSIYSVDQGGKQTAYFLWGPGDRPEGLYAYANDTLFCDTRIPIRIGYPETTSSEVGPTRVEGHFHPAREDESIIFHFVLPEGYVPTPTPEVPEQPNSPFVCAVKNRVCVTYAVRGSARIKFWIRSLDIGENLDQFDWDKLFPYAKRLNGRFGITIGFPPIQWRWDQVV